MTEREDALLERVLQRVDHPGLEDPGLDLRGDDRRLWREYGELAGLLPQALEPVTPRPEIWEGILAGARRDGAGMETRPVPGPGGADLPPRRSPVATRALAAAVAALVLGTGLYAGWLTGERTRLRETIAGLELRVEEGSRREQELRDAEAELSRLRGVFTSAGMRACLLRPWGERPAQPVARAVVYFDGERGQWFLAARDLEPCRQGSHYVLWFLVDGKPVPGGSFRPERGVPVALAAREVPGASGGAFLTLEPDPAVEAPTGPPILYGEDAEQML